MSEHIRSIQILFHNERQIDPHSLRELYATLRWWPERSEQDIAEVLNNFPAVGALGSATPRRLRTCRFRWSLSSIHRRYGRSSSLSTYGPRSPITNQVK